MLVDACGKICFALFTHHVGGHRDNRYAIKRRGQGANRTSCVLPVHLRNPDIHQHQVEGRGLHPGKRLQTFAYDSQRCGIMISDGRHNMFKIGIDLGGTKIEGIALDSQGRELKRQRIATEAEGGPMHIVARIASLYAGLAYSIDGAPHTLGVGTPGAISKKTGLLKNSNTVCLNGQPLTAMLETALHHRLRIENDANCFALAEALHGAGRGHDCVFGVIMGTGCGGGLVLGGQVRTGPQAIAGEWGHMVIDPAGPACYCGARGCVETFISGGGLAQRLRLRSGRDLSAERIIANAEAGDPECVAALDDFHARFGQAVANLLAVLDPDIVVIGGGLSNLDSLYTRGVEEIARRVFSDALTTPIVRNLLGDSAGVIGAALLGC